MPLNNKLITALDVKFCLVLCDFRGILTGTGRVLICLYVYLCISGYFGSSLLGCRVSFSTSLFLVPLPVSHSRSHTIVVARRV